MIEKEQNSSAVTLTLGDVYSGTRLSGIRVLKAFLIVTRLPGQFLIGYTSNDSVQQNENVANFLQKQYLNQTGPK